MEDPYRAGELDNLALGDSLNLTFKIDMDKKRSIAAFVQELKAVKCTLGV